MRKTFKSLHTIINAKYETAKKLAELANTDDMKNKYETQVRAYADMLCLLEFDSDYFTAIYNIWKD